VYRRKSLWYWRGQQLIVDIVLELEKGNLSKFIKVVKKLGWEPKIPVKLEDFIDPEKRKAWRMDKGIDGFQPL